jgi:signal transduction histidine kinase
MSNAIRFTDMSTGLREIKVSLEIAPDPPVNDTCAHPPLVLGRNGRNRSPEPDTGDTPVYIYVCVQDSGPGLQKEDLALLFQRWAQRLLVFICPLIQNTGLGFNRDRLVYGMLVQL